MNQMNFLAGIRDCFSEFAVRMSTIICARRVDVPDGLQLGVGTQKPVNILMPLTIRGNRASCINHKNTQTERG